MHAMTRNTFSKQFSALLELLRLQVFGAAGISKSGVKLGVTLYSYTANMEFNAP